MVTISPVYFRKNPMQIIKKAPKLHITADQVISYTGAEYTRTNRPLSEMLAWNTYPIDFFKDLAGKKVLDVGTGGGQFILDIEKNYNAKAIGLDIVPHENFKKYPKNFIVADAANTNLNNEYFDTIFSAYSIFSIDTDNVRFQTRVLRELKRILKTNGRIRLGDTNIAKIQLLAKTVGGLKITKRNANFLGYGWIELQKHG